MLTIDIARCNSWEHATALRHMAESDGYPAAIAHIKHATTGEENFAFIAFVPFLYANGLSVVAAEFLTEPTGAAFLRDMARKNGGRRDRVPAWLYGKILGLLVKGLVIAAAGTGFDVLNIEPSSITGRDPLLDPNAF